MKIQQLLVLEIFINFAAKGSNLLNGLATVPRMTMDVNAIQKLLFLPESSLPVLNNPIGYEK